MMRPREIVRTVPFYQPVPLTELPLIYHREHLFPYRSYGATAEEAVLRDLKLIVLENEALRVEVAPELGGRVYSLFDKRSGQEILFSNPVIKPVRILPIWAFISGGIEFNFPIAHSPTSIATVGYAAGQVGDYGFIRVGEREARTGMEWVVELGLVEGSPVLVQRTAFRNQTGADHPWMAWTIAAVRSTEGTEFVHPPHRVLVHDHRVVELDWPGDGLNLDRNARQMTALFWKPSQVPLFGAFHHELGFGLMHLADPQQLPGKKVWTYGYGRHRSWGQATTEGNVSYAEIESGPLLDQSEKPLFPAGGERRFEEFWIPVHSRVACDQRDWPALRLPPMVDPWLGWTHSPWQTEWERFSAGEGPLPASVVPTGLELESALRREVERTPGALSPSAGRPQASLAEDASAYTGGDSRAGRDAGAPTREDSGAGNDAGAPSGRGATAAESLALWLAFRGRPKEALPLVERSPSRTARRVAGLICWKALEDPLGAVPHLEAGPVEDPVALAELDELYAALGQVERRAQLLKTAPNHRLIVERRADLALATGDPAETIRLLSETKWPREHQRYVRTELWQKAKAALGEREAEPPDWLHEDNLARFGAYWSDR